MNIFIFYIKEIIKKSLYLLIIIIFTIFIVMYKIKIILLFILSPIKNTIISNYIYVYNTDIKTSLYQDQLNLNFKNELFIQVIETNLPFIINSYYYYKYVTLFSLYLILPLILYIIIISFSNTFNYKEYKILLKNAIIFISVQVINLFILQHLILKLYLKYLYSHYMEFEYYEFDIEFKIIEYLNLYFFLLFLNILLFFIINKKKHFKINTIILAIAVILLLPNEIILQGTYLLIISISIVVTKIINNYKNEIKKYVIME